jgi:hypothetical protein
MRLASWSWGGREHVGTVFRESMPQSAPWPVASCKLGECVSVDGASAIGNPFE